MKVRALERGFVGRLVERGDVFEIDPEQLAPWMEPVDEPQKPQRKAKVAAPEAEPQQAEDLA